LIFKYYPYDLNALLLTEPLKFDQVCFYLHRLLLGLQLLHKAKFVHRDVKPENILIDINHDLVLTDFGLAREITGTLTGKVGTQYYRAPEQLLGDTGYGTAVDIWAVGCLMYTMLTGKTLFEGRSDSDQFDEICNLMGSPTVEDWPEMLRLPNGKLFLPTKPKRRNFKKILGERFATRKPAVPAEYIDLMMLMLDWNPEYRITAEKALMKPLFSGVENLAGTFPVLTVREMHQKKQMPRAIGNYWLDGFDFKIEGQLPRQYVV
jgi:serine/threonine protein kinase